MTRKRASSASAPSAARGRWRCRTRTSGRAARPSPCRRRGCRTRCRRRSPLLPAPRTSGARRHRSHGAEGTGRTSRSVRPVPGLLDRVRRRPAPIAFVLGGGGNLGAVQIGMLRALAERRIVPDLIVGCSVGALNGAGFAQDPTLVGVARLEERWRRLDARSIMPAGWWPTAVHMARKGSAVHDSDGLRRRHRGAGRGPALRGAGGQVRMRRHRSRRRPRGVVRPRAARRADPGVRRHPVGVPAGRDRRGALRGRRRRQRRPRVAEPSSSAHE